MLLDYLFLFFMTIGSFVLSFLPTAETIDTYLPFLYMEEIDTALETILGYMPRLDLILPMETIIAATLSVMVIEILIGLFNFYRFLINVIRGSGA